MNIRNRMKNHAIVVIIGLSFFLTMIPIMETKNSDQIDTAIDILPSYSVKCKTFLCGSISGMDWDDHTQSSNPDLEINVRFALIYSKIDNATLGILGVILFKTVSYKSVQSIEGYYSSTWICGSVSHSVRIGVP